MLPTKGKDGREVELRKGTYFIQWRYKGEPLWHNLIAISELKGEKGKPGNSLNLGLAARQVQLRSENGYVQWHWAGQKEWTNLYKIPTGGSGGGGSADYNDLINKPDLSKYESAPALNVPRSTPINVDYGQIDVIGANRMAQLPINQITVETSTDGVTWQSYNITDKQKRLLVYGGAVTNANISVPKSQQIRITLDAWRSPTEPDRYVTLNKLWMWTQTEVDTQVKIERATRGEPNNWLTVTPFGESVSNWPGSIIVNHQTLTFGGNVAQNSNNAKVRVTLKSTGTTGNIEVMNLRWYGPEVFNNGGNPFISNNQIIQMDEFNNPMINGVTIAVGVGSPEGKITANVGSMYIDKNATGGVVRWVKTSGDSNTGWTAEVIA